MIFRLPILLLAVLFGAASCGDSAEASAARKESREALDALHRLVVTTWDDARRQAEPRVDALRERLGELESRLAEQSESVRESTAAMVEKARAALESSTERMRNFGEDGGTAVGEAWQAILEDLEQARTSIDKAWEASGEGN